MKACQREVTRVETSAILLAAAGPCPRFRWRLKTWPALKPAPRSAHPCCHRSCCDGTCKRTAEAIVVPLTLDPLVLSTVHAAFSLLRSRSLLDKVPPLRRSSWDVSAGGTGRFRRSEDIQLLRRAQLILRLELRPKGGDCLVGLLPTSPLESMIHRSMSSPGWPEPLRLTRLGDGIPKGLGGAEG